MSGNFVPNIEQQAIFAAIQNGSGNLFISAGAGSGKTTSLVEASKLIDRSSAIFVAFNKTIVDELTTRLPAGMDCKTMHSCGRGAVWTYAGKPQSKDWNFGGKYRTLAKIWAASVGVNETTEGYADFIEAMDDFCRFARLTLTDSTNDAAVEALVKKYELTPLVTDPARAAAGLRQMLAWGTSKQGLPQNIVTERTRTLSDPRTYGVLDCIDFTDMIYLPIALNLWVRQYRWIFVDEAQDLSPCQQELVSKMLAPGGRMVYVGDPRQAIYSFAGADSNSVENIISRTGATVLPLMCCYRCPQSHIRAANSIVPELRARDNAPEGTVRQLAYEQLHAVVEGGDMILCRTTAPLVSTCFDLIRAGKPAVVRGRDIGQQLSKVVRTVAKQAGFQWVNFQWFLEQWERNMVSSLSRKEGTEMQIQSVQDKAQCIQVFHENRATHVQDAESLCASIEAFFSDNDRGAVVCSTIHKSKGLEADNTFLLRFDLMPHPMAKSADTQQQEEHLQYIALTRAKSTMTFIIGDGTERGKGKGTPPPAWLTEQEQPAEKGKPARCSSNPLIGAPPAPQNAPIEVQTAYLEMINLSDSLEDEGILPPDYTWNLGETSQDCTLKQLQARIEWLNERAAQSTQKAA